MYASALITVVIGEGKYGEMKEIVVAMPIAHNFQAVFIEP
jgi:hypothetical protein